MVKGSILEKSRAVPQSSAVIAPKKRVKFHAVLVGNIILAFELPKGRRTAVSRIARDEQMDLNNVLGTRLTKKSKEQCNNTLQVHENPSQRPSSPFILHNSVVPCRDLLAPSALFNIKLSFSSHEIRRTLSCPTHAPLPISQPEKSGEALALGNWFAPTIFTVPIQASTKLQRTSPIAFAPHTQTYVSLYFTRARSRFLSVQSYLWYSF